MGAANNRIFYATTYPSFAPESTITLIQARGVQNCGSTGSNNLFQIFQQGDLAIYENKEDIPDVQFTAQKALDGNPLLYHLATQGATAGGIPGRSKVKTNVVLANYSDAQNSASGTPVSEQYMSGLTVSSIAYGFQTDGPFTEDITLNGFDKVYRNTGVVAALSSGTWNNNEVPAALFGSGGVNIRQSLLWIAPGVASLGFDANGAVNANGSSNGAMTILPPDIDGISASGTNDLSTGGAYGAHVQSIQVSCDFNRQNLLELGRKAAYFRYVTFPVQVTCAITTNAVVGDTISITSAGAAGNGNNTVARTIKVACQEGTFINLGTQNKLNSIDRTGGDVGGQNVTLTYNYLTFNDLTVTHPADPTVARRSD